MLDARNRDRRHAEAETDRRVVVQHRPA
jgi:hypothetical protein